VVSLSETDSEVCSLDATVTVSFTTHCLPSLIDAGSCDTNVVNRVFTAILQLSSVDFCAKVGGATTLSVSSIDTEQAPLDPTTALMSSPVPLTNFVVGTDIGVRFGLVAVPAIPISILQVSAVLENRDDDSQSTTYTSVSFTQANNAGTQDAIFTLTTGTNTPWLLQATGQIYSAVVQVTATVSYDASTLSLDPVTLTLRVPLGGRSFQTQAQSAKEAGVYSPETTASVTQTTPTFTIQNDGYGVSSSKLSPGAIAGIVVGCSAVLILLIGVIGFAASKRLSGYAAPAAAPPAPLPRIIDAGTV